MEEALLAADGDLSVMSVFKSLNCLIKLSKDISRQDRQGQKTPADRDGRQGQRLGKTDASQRLPEPPSVSQSLPESPRVS